MHQFIMSSLAKSMKKLNILQTREMSGKGEMPKKVVHAGLLPKWMRMNSSDVWYDVSAESEYMSWCSPVRAVRV